MSDLSKIGGSTKNFSGETEQIMPVIEDVNTESILNVMNEILDELRLQTELLKGILR